jgi:hypothetical protein
MHSPPSLSHRLFPASIPDPKKIGLDGAANALKAEKEMMHRDNIQRRSMLQYHCIRMALHGR